MGHWSDNHYTITREPTRTVRSCNHCDYSTAHIAGPGTGSQNAQVFGNKCRGWIIQHLKDYHPEVMP